MSRFKKELATQSLTVGSKKALKQVGLLNALSRESFMHQQIWKLDIFRAEIEKKVP